MSKPVGTLVKTMDLLDALADAGPVGVMELSRLLEMDKSAVSRLLSTLKSRQYVRVDEHGQYDLGLRLFELGQRLQDRLPFRKAIIPHVDALAAETGESAYAVQYHYGKIAYLHDCVSSQEIRLGQRVGIRCDFWQDIAGKVILAHHDEPSVLAALTEARKLKTKGLPAKNDLLDELSRIRRCGYAIFRDEEKCLVAAPMPNNHATVSVALMVGGPAHRIQVGQAKKLGQMIIRRAAEASQAIGWISPGTQQKTAG